MTINGRMLGCHDRRTTPFTRQPVGPPTTATPTGTMRASSAPIGGGRPRTRPPTCCPPAVGLDVLDVGCGPGTITVDLARRVGRAGWGWTAPLDVIDLARARRRRRGVRQRRASPWATPTPSISPTTRSMSSTPTRYCSTWPIRPPPWPRWAGSAGRGVWWPPVTATTGPSPGTRPIPGSIVWLEVYCQVARHNGGHPDGGRRLLAWARAAGFTDVTAHRPRPGASRSPTTGAGGATCGPIG